MRNVRNALKADLADIGRTGQDLARRLEAAREVRIMAPNGTDLRFEVEGRKALLEDGVVDAEDLKRGALWASLPAGSVVMAPRETTASGTAVFDRMALWGRVLTNVRWTFEDGRLTQHSAGRNRAVWEKFYGGATGDKDRIGSFSVGLNPKGKPLGLNLTDWYLAGAVSIGIGNNDYLGGTNQTGFAWSGVVPEATVELDGQEIVATGRLA